VELGLSEDSQSLEKLRLLKEITVITSDHHCPGFGQDRVNFHRTPGRGTAGGWGLTHLAKQSPVFHTMCRHAGFRWQGGRRGGNSLAARERAALVLSRREGLLCEFVSCFLLICTVVVTVPSVCCSVKLPLY